MLNTTEKVDPQGKGGKWNQASKTYNISARTIHVYM